ncbi:hypothetical protein SAMN05445850_2547 [Paraburkholderia tuberum]|uniref:Uncharacterized protein n=1 Tax=Paraburkholderia tuberum TaxID=157910 RepID=A0A1H1FSC4_9BURK|nr:hypothetical protein SAMN05445850_2547 [Paraburkholderia tuberum]
MPVTHFYNRSLFAVLGVGVPEQLVNWDAGHDAGARLERERIGAILNHPAAQGRHKSAVMLALTPAWRRKRRGVSWRRFPKAMANAAALAFPLVSSVRPARVRKPSENGRPHSGRNTARVLPTAAQMERSTVTRPAATQYKQVRRPPNQPRRLLTSKPAHSPSGRMPLRFGDNMASRKSDLLTDAATQPLDEKWCGLGGRVIARYTKARAARG